MVVIRDFANSSAARALAVLPSSRSVLVAKDWMPPKGDNLELWDSETGRKQGAFCLTYALEVAKGLDATLSWLIRRIAAAYGVKVENVPLMAIFDIDVSPDGGRVALACGHDVRVFRADFSSSRFSHLATFRGHGDDVNYVSFSSDRSLAGSASGDATAVVWKVASGRAIRRVGEQGVALGVARLTPDNKHLIVGGGTRHAENSISIREVATGTCLNRIRDFEPGLVGGGGGLDVWLDGRTLAFSAQSQTARICNLATGESYEFPRPPGEIAALFFHPDGSHVVCCWNAETETIGDIASVVAGGHLSVCGPDLSSPLLGSS